MRASPLLFALPLALLACEVAPDEEDVAPPPALSLAASGGAPTQAALDAIDAVPAWMRDDLLIALKDLAPERQDELAALVLEAEDPRWVDEIGFTIAHLSPEVLSSTRFVPGLLTENARLVYERDPDLPYVELVEVGEPDDPERYTTTRYRVADTAEDGTQTVSEFTIDRDVYYWYVVHPRLEDERPYYINPTIPNAPATTPEAGGRFWREYLWMASDADCPDGVGQCPRLADDISAQDVLWARKGGNADNGAMGSVIRWVNATMHFGALQERSVQPVRIYNIHHGNCGEHGDISSAAMRIGLIPTIVIEARGNDHCWGEFWDPEWGDDFGTGWTQVEPVNNSIDYYGYYADAERNYRRTLDGLDDDCDGTADEGRDTSDRDGDGVTVAQGDCNDQDVAIHPGAEELPNARDDDCDGTADEGWSVEDVDADGDGFTLLEGDCHDLDPAVHPEAFEDLENGRDDDCDGWADRGPGDPDNLDLDGDGVTIALGDCDDGNSAIAPGRLELNNAIDDDCDGTADEDLNPLFVDRDRDGVAMVGGDCDDTRPGLRPGQRDPRISNNRLYFLTGGRGDAWVINRTTRYTRTFPMRVSVKDRDGEPVEGATVSFFGPAEVYNTSSLWFVGESYTDWDGLAVREFGESNAYRLRVDSPIGSFPEDEDSLVRVVDWTDEGVPVDFEVTIDRAARARPEAEDSEDVLSWAPGAWTLRVAHEVTEHRLHGTSTMLHDSFSYAAEGGAVDRFVVERRGWERFLEGRSIKTAVLGADLPSDEVEVVVPEWEWYVVLRNPRGGSTVLGNLTVEASPVAGDAAPVSFTTPFVLGPEQHVAIRLDPTREGPWSE